MTNTKLSFFLPFEFDQIPREWHPWDDDWEEKKGRLFIYECFKNIPFDGLLISKSKFDTNKSRFSHLLKNNKKLKDAFSIPKDIKLFGDCGAFQYRNEEKPPYTAQEILNYYQDHGFDMGCSIDHIITNKKDVSEREKRYQITKEYAKKCIDLYNENDYTFELFGVAQGWDIQSYSRIIEFLLELGYKNLCIGGLVGLNKKKIENENDLTLENLLVKLEPKFKKFKRVHIFGRGNIEYLPLFIDVGVTQFDNNVMRKSWTDEKRSYFLYNKKNRSMKYYTSIRLPLTENKQGKQELDTKIFNDLRDFSNNGMNIQDFILSLKNFYEKYNKLNKKKFELNENLITNLLIDAPWKKCECDLCAKYQIHVSVFRRRMRNMSRGFHNVYNYFSLVNDVRSAQNS